MDDSWYQDPAADDGKRESGIELEVPAPREDGWVDEPASLAFVEDLLAKFLLYILEDGCLTKMDLESVSLTCTKVNKTITNILFHMMSSLEKGSESVVGVE
jgi:hypothetical protein